MAILIADLWVTISVMVIYLISRNKYSLTVLVELITVRYCHVFFCNYVFSKNVYLYYMRLHVSTLRCLQQKIPISVSFYLFFSTYSVCHTPFYLFLHFCLFCMNFEIKNAKKVGRCMPIFQWLLGWCHQVYGL